MWAVAVVLGKVPHSLIIFIRTSENQGCIYVKWQPMSSCFGGMKLGYIYSTYNCQIIVEEGGLDCFYGMGYHLRPGHVNRMKK